MTSIGGIIIINTNISICIPGKKPGYTFVPINDLNSQYILFTGKINDLIKNNKIYNKTNLLAIVKITDKIYNKLTEVVLECIIGPIYNPENYYKTILYYNPLYPINIKKYNNVLSLDDNNKVNTFIESLNINCSEQLYTITIDPNGCKDIDDAISYIDDNNFVIHIADPNKFNDCIDLKKYYNNYTSLYFGYETYHLLPLELSTNYISLLENKIRPVISVYFVLIDNKPFINKIIRQNIMINKNLSYDEANTILKNESNNNINKLFEISKKLESIYYQNDKISTDTHDMIELFMLLTNNKIAEYLSEHNVTNVLYKNCNDQLSYYTYHNIGHNKLNLQYYVHFTSPIRRTADYIIHQQVINCIESINQTFEIAELSKYNDILHNIKIVSNNAKYVYIANMINNGDIYKCKLIEFNKTTGLFKWYILNHDLKFSCKLCHDDFLENHHNLINNLKINEIHEIRLYKFNMGKLQLTKITFEFLKIDTIIL